MATEIVSAYDMLDSIVDLSSIKISERNILKSIKFEVEIVETPEQEGE